MCYPGSTSTIDEEFGVTLPEANLRRHLLVIDDKAVGQDAGDSPKRQGNR